MSESENSSRITRLGRRVGEIIIGPRKKELDPSQDFLLLDRALNPADPITATLNPDSNHLEIDLSATPEYRTASIPLFEKTHRSSSRTNLDPSGFKINEHIITLLSQSTVGEPTAKQISCHLPLTLTKEDGTSTKTLGFQISLSRFQELQQIMMETLIAKKDEINPTEFQKLQQQYEQILLARRTDKEKALHIDLNDDIQVKEITATIAGKQRTTAYLEIPKGKRAIRIPVATKNVDNQWVPTPEASNIAQLDLTPSGEKTPAVQDAKRLFKGSTSLTGRQMSDNRDYHLDIRVADEPIDPEWRNQFTSCDPHQAEYTHLYSKGVVFRGKASVKIAQSKIHQWLVDHQSGIFSPDGHLNPIAVRYQNLEAKGQFNGLDPEHPEIIEHTGLKRTVKLPETSPARVEENELIIAESEESDPRKTRVIEVFQTRPDGTKDLTDAGYLLLWTTPDRDEKTYKIPTRGLTIKHKGKYEQHQWNKIKLTPDQHRQLRNAIWLQIRDHQENFTPEDVNNIYQIMERQIKNDQEKTLELLNKTISVAEEEIDQLFQEIEKLNNRSQKQQQALTHTQRIAQSWKSTAKKISRWSKKDKDKSKEHLAELWDTKRKEKGKWYPSKLIALAAIKATGKGAELARKVSESLPPSPISPEANTTDPATITSEQQGDSSQPDSASNLEKQWESLMEDPDMQKVKAVILTAGEALSKWVSRGGQKGIALMAQGGQKGAEQLAIFLENDKKRSQEDLNKNARPVVESLIPLMAIGITFGSENLTGLSAVALQKLSDKVQKREQKVIHENTQTTEEIRQIIADRQNILSKLKKSVQEILDQEKENDESLLTLPPRPNVAPPTPVPPPVTSEIPTTPTAPQSSSPETPSTPPRPPSLSQSISGLIAQGPPSSR